MGKTSGVLRLGKYNKARQKAKGKRQKANVKKK
jgi:hypothetical protein